MDRSETAWFLIDRSAEAGVADDSGMTALVMMISKMPSVVSGVYLSRLPARGHWVVFLRRALYFRSAQFPPRFINELLRQPDKMVGVT